MTSPSYVHESYAYDVFLSFSGEDTRRTFVDHLYAALDRQGICTFKDDNRLEKGKKINDKLLQSIQDSRLHIIVFSKKYASSSWCLNELLTIMECQKNGQQITYPVFYDVEPTEVRKQSGSVGEALSVHTNEPEVGKWRGALAEAANLSGWDLRKTADGHEAQVIRLIVEEVSRKLCSFNYVNTIDERLVGMEHRMTDLELFLEIGLDDVRMIGMKGMGGVGKTTLARAIFDKLSTQFEAKTFVENVREVSKASLSGLNLLQIQVLTDVTKDKFIAVSSVHDGINMMKRRLRGKKVLLVLDDVDHVSQLEALAGDNSWFKPGSRIIITTRDEQVLLSHRVTLIHHVDLLTDGEVMRLFSRYAFGKDIPVKEYEKESLKVVSYAVGLPLTAKVLGSLLCGKDKPEWIDTLARLKTIPLEETVKKLELSYESLEDEHKQIFLDVACLLKNWKRDDAVRMLDSCGYHARNGLRVLQRKSLITIEEVEEETELEHILRDESGRYEQIRMHDHIEEMGKNIVRRLHLDEPCRHSRLWVQDEIEHILARDMVIEETRCIRILTLDIDLTSLLNMKKLRCLIVDYHSQYIGDHHRINICIYLPNSLRYLNLRHYPYACLPKIYGANNLVALEIYKSGITQLWEGGMAIKKLKYLVLNGVFHLMTCDLGLFPNLELLYLKACWVLENLPDSMCMLEHLKTLALTCCFSLKKLPEDLGQLKSLEVLDLLFCRRIRDIPSSICKLKHLKTLYLGGCSSLEKLPEDLGKLESLEVLNLSGCESIRDIPNSICMLKRLRELNLKSCEKIRRLPEDLGDLECLRELNIESTNISQLPQSISLLKGLILRPQQWKMEGKKG